MTETVEAEHYAIVGGKIYDLRDRREFDYGKMVWLIPYKHPGYVTGWNPNKGREHEVFVKFLSDRPKTHWYSETWPADWLIWLTPHNGRHFLDNMLEARERGLHAKYRGSDSNADARLQSG